MSDNEILKLLKDNNPFISSASPLPWDNSNPDLLQLSREASEDIEQLMRHKRREPDTPLAGLIIGEHGSGKTHMLTRILRKLRNNSRPTIFVTVRAFRDSETASKHLLSEIFISLKKEHSNGRIQFDVLMSEFINSYQEHRRNDGFTRIDNIDPRTYIARDIPELDRTFLKCLISYVNSGDRDIRDDILEWLCNGLDDEDSLRLGLPLRNLDSMTDARREQEAEKVLVSLGHVLAYSKALMIVCFDQLDGMRDEKLIQTWGDIINLMLNDLLGMLPLCFMTSEIWSDRFLPVLSDSVTQRLRNNIIIMKSCSLSQADLLIQSRIESAFKDKQKSTEIYKWLISKLKNKLKEGYSPRHIIELANHFITGIKDSNELEPKIDTENIIKNIYDDEYKKVQSESDSWPPNADQIITALEIWLKSHEGFKFTASPTKSIKLTGIYNNSMKFAFMAVTARNHIITVVSAKSGIEFLKKNPNGFACFITETKVQKKTWKQAGEALEKFQSLGGHVIYLDGNTRIKWYSLTALINRIDNGDVNLYDNKTASRDDVKEFVRSIKLFDFPFDSKSDDKNSPVNIPVSTPVNKVVDKDLLKNLKSIVDSSPMCIISIGKAVEMLSNMEVEADPAEILTFIQNHREIFKTFKSQNGEVLITTMTGN